MTGSKYERLQSHDANEPEETPVASSSTHVSSKEHYSSKRGRGGYFKRGEDRTKWKGRGRENSPYQRPTSESTSKTVEVVKSKDKQ